MQSTLTYVITLLICISISSCCNLSECIEDGGLIKLRLLRNNKNVLYGPDAFIHQNSVRHFVLSDAELENQVEFIDSLQAIQIFVPTGFTSIIEIAGLGSETFNVTTEVLGDDNDCCHTYRLNSVLRNGQVICTGECEEVIDIEI